MFTIKSALKVTILTASLFALSGCGDTGCCGESTMLGSANPAPNSTVNIEENGNVATSKPAIEPKSVDFIPPSAHITINGEEEDVVKVTTCADNDFSAENSNDPDGDNTNLTYQWTGTNQEDLGTDLSFIKKFCDDGLYEVSLIVTDEQNLTAKDSACLLVGMDEMPLVIDTGEDQTVNLGDEVTLSARVLCQDDTGFEYKWTDCGETVSTESSFTTSDLDVGEHKFKVVVKDPEGHCVSKYVTVTVTL